MALFQPLSKNFKGQKDFYLISISALFFTLGSGAVWFIIPLLADRFFKDYVLVGLVVATPSIISFLFDIPIGCFSDYIGCKRLIIVGLLIMLFLGFLLPSIVAPLVLIIFVVIVGFSDVFILVPVRTYVMHIVPKDHTSSFFGLFETMIQLGFTVGPLIAGYLLASTLDSGLSAVGILYALSAFVVVLLILPMRDSIHLRGQFFQSILRVIRVDKVYLRSIVDFNSLGSAGFGIIVTTFLLVFIDGVIWAFVPLYSVGILSPIVASIVMAMFVLPFIIFQVPAGIVADKVGKTTILIFGMFLSGVFFMVFGSTLHSPLLILSAFLATCGLALARPAVDGFLTDISSSMQKGGIVGFWNISEDFAYIVSPLIGGAIAKLFGIGSAFTTIGLLLILSTPLIYLTTKKNKIN